MEPPRAAPPLLDIRSFLTYRIARLHFALNAQALRALRRHSDLTLAQWRVLALVADAKDASASELVRRSAIDKGLFSRTARQLEAAGLVASVRSETDRRQQRLSVTDQGARVHSAVLPHMRRRQAGLLDTLTDDQRSALLSALDALEGAAEFDFDIDR